LTKSPTAKENLAMYEVAVNREFDAQHFLIGGDWGPENDLHEHHYQVEVQLQGSILDQHGYLVDIVDIEIRLEKMINQYQGKVLNDLPEFEGLNPSIENFSRIFCLGLAQGVTEENISSIKIILWENEIAWASFRLER
jgi:6-pyruvoyltetrahydropterin/6-carboxytetrahydropterin synthase